MWSDTSQEATGTDAYVVPQHMHFPAVGGAPRALHGGHHAAPAAGQQEQQQQRFKVPHPGGGSSLQGFLANMASHSGAAYSPRVLPYDGTTLGGVIFHCNLFTISENLDRMVFGMAERKQRLVEKITHGLPLFLYNTTTKELYAGFTADGNGGMLLEPHGWQMRPERKTKKKRRAYNRKKPSFAQSITRLGTEERAAQEQSLSAWGTEDYGGSLSAPASLGVSSSLLGPAPAPTGITSFPAQVRVRHTEDFAPLPYSAIPAGALTSTTKNGPGGHPYSASPNQRTGKYEHFEQTLSPSQVMLLFAVFRARAEENRTNKNVAVSTQVNLQQQQIQLQMMQSEQMRLLHEQQAKSHAQQLALVQAQIEAQQDVQRQMQAQMRHQQQHGRSGFGDALGHGGVAGPSSAFGMLADERQQQQQQYDVHHGQQHSHVNSIFRRRHAPLQFRSINPEREPQQQQQQEQQKSTTPWGEGFLSLKPSSTLSAASAPAAPYGMNAGSAFPSFGGGSVVQIPDPASLLPATSTMTFSSVGGAESLAFPERPGLVSEVSKQAAPRSEAEAEAEVTHAASRELHGVVAALTMSAEKGGCPWTASVDAPTMLGHLQSECAEIAEALAVAPATEKSDQELVLELGDALFDSASSTFFLSSLTCSSRALCLYVVPSPTLFLTPHTLLALFPRPPPPPHHPAALMLIRIAARDRGIDPAAPWRAAAVKVKSRTPYMSAWRSGDSTAETAEEALAYWARAKEVEKEKRSKDAAASSGASSETGSSGTAGAEEY